MENVDIATNASADTVNKVTTRDRCSLFFSYMAESAKLLTPKQQNFLINECQKILFEVQQQNEGEAQ